LVPNLESLFLKHIYMHVTKGCMLISYDATIKYGVGGGGWPRLNQRNNI
jgi:hypothetical protein